MKLHAKKHREVFQNESFKKPKKTHKWTPNLIACAHKNKETT